MRPSFDQYLLAMAQTASLRGDCTRRQVGCVIADASRRIVATGYNGTTPRAVGCIDGGCPRAISNANPGEGYEESRCIALHAEMNAVAHGEYERMLGGTAYINEPPCYMCQKVLAAAGIVRAVWPDGEMSFGV